MGCRDCCASHQSRQRFPRHAQIPMTRQMEHVGAEPRGLAARAVAVVADGVSPGEDAGSPAVLGQALGWARAGSGSWAFAGPVAGPRKLAESGGSEDMLKIIIDPLLAAHLADLAHRIPSDH